MRGRRWTTDLLQDVRYAVRLFTRAPAFTAVAVTTLALGIGANTAVFSAIDSVLLRPLPFKNPEQLVVVWNRNLKEQGPSKLFQSYRDFEEYARHVRSFDAVSTATWAIGPQLWRAHGQVREVLALPVGPTFFTMLGVQPSLGRTFLPEDERAGCSIVLSHRFWQNELGGPSDVVGQSLDLDRRPCVVLGVTSPEFAFYPAAAQLWTLLGPDFQPGREQLSLGVFGRLKSGATREQAQSEVASLYAGLHRSDRLERDLVPVVYPLQQEFTWLTSRTLRTTLIALGGAVGLVLLVACVNVASLLLSRSASRARELAIRVAIGAGRERLMRQLLTEGFLLATVGSAVGVLMAYSTIRYVAYARPIELPPGVELRIHGTTLIFTAALSMATTLAFGLVPAWRGSLARPDERLKAGGRGSIGHGSTHRFLRGLVFAQVALSVALLAAAGLLIDSVVRLGAESIGFDPNHLLSSHITLPKERYSEESRQRQLYRTLEDRISQLPGVTGAALTSGFIVGGAPVQEVEISGRASSAQRRAMQFAVSNHTFGVFRIPVVRGRSFTESDGSDSAPVAIVNGAFASEYLGNAPPLGQRIRIGDAAGQNPWLTIVGVVGNVKGAALYNEMGWTEPPTVFRPLTQYSSRSLSLVIRTAGRLDGIGRLVQRQIVDVDSEIPINEPILVSAWVAQRFTYPRFRALVFGAFAVLALLLAAVGLYGVLSQFVAARKQEFALRMALGASRGHIFRLVSAYGGMPLVAGFAVGIAASMVAARAVANLLYGVHPGDPLIVGVTAVALFVVAGFALVLPARRAVNVEPVAALRDE